MNFFEIYLVAFLVIMGMMTILWFISVLIRNVSIVDLFWGFGFVLAAATYFILSPEFSSRGLLILCLAAIWGLRLTIYLSWRNIGKAEDFRYQNFREKYGQERYWWVSFFQTFLLQGTLMWLISAPLLGAQYFGSDRPLFWLDYLGIFFWIIGFFFETIGDLQLARFKSLSTNKGKVLDKGLWRYTRHPNYFGDAAVWWGFGMISMAAGCYLPVLGSLLMTGLIIKVSGVALLEKTLKEDKPEYREYVRKTSAFIPWFPKK